MTFQPCPWPTLLLVVVAGLSACGGGGGGGAAAPAPAPLPAPNPTPLPGIRASAESPFAVRCGADSQSGTLYRNAEVEPFVAVNPLNSSNLIGVWQQDRFSNGGAQGLLAGVSTNGGQTWVIRSATFSRCTGGNSTNGGDYVRASDPWVSFAPDGSAYQVSLSFTGGAFEPGSVNAMLVSRSSDGGLSWGAPISLQRDGADAFNDKQAVTADPADARYAYVVWDRLTANTGPTLLARTVNGGASWEATRVIHDPGAGNQTIGNQIVVLPSGVLVNLFTRIDGGPNNTIAALRLMAMRSTDKGASWEAPVRIADLLAIGARDPETGKNIRDGSLIAEIAAGPDGSLHVAWQDARFSGGARDAIAYARSRDGGLTWSAPVRVSADASVQAFTPSVHVRADGVIGISYSDLRSNTASNASLLADHWLLRSSDGLNWSEQRLSGPFDLNGAPDAGGLFVGDYQGLRSVGGNFIAFFVQTTGSSTNATDVFAVLSGNSASASAQKFSAQPASDAGALPGPVSAAFAAQVQRNAELRVRQPPFHWLAKLQKTL